MQQLGLYLSAHLCQHLFNRLHACMTADFIVAQGLFSGTMLDGPSDESECHQQILAPVDVAKETVQIVLNKPEEAHARCWLHLLTPSVLDGSGWLRLCRQTRPGSMAAANTGTTNCRPGPFSQA